jgi:hypothetical protein
MSQTHLTPANTFAAQQPLSRVYIGFVRCVGRGAAIIQHQLPIPTFTKRKRKEQRVEMSYSHHSYWNAYVAPRQEQRSYWDEYVAPRPTPAPKLAPAPAPAAHHWSYHSYSYHSPSPPTPSAYTSPYTSPSPHYSPSSAYHTSPSPNSYSNQHPVTKCVRPPYTAQGLNNRAMEIASLRNRCDGLLDEAREAQRRGENDRAERRLKQVRALMKGYEF